MAVVLGFFRLWYSLGRRAAAIAASMTVIREGATTKNSKGTDWLKFAVGR
jgi:hypothetical protein